MSENETNDPNKELAFKEVIQLRDGLINQEVKNENNCELAIEVRKMVVEEVFARANVFDDGSSALKTQNDFHWALKQVGKNFQGEVDRYNDQAKKSGDPAVDRPSLAELRYLRRLRKRVKAFVSEKLKGSISSMQEEQFKERFGNMEFCQKPFHVPGEAAVGGDGSRFQPLNSR